MTFSCCEVCDRNPTCGVDCGSCEVEDCPECGGYGFYSLSDDPDVEWQCEECGGTGVAPREAEIRSTSREKEGNGT